jgi:hypothetical protein
MMQIIQKIILIFGGIFVGLLLAEGVARLIRPAKDADLLFNSPDASPSGLYVLNKETRLIPAPNFSDTAQALGYKVKLRTNSLSLRGPPSEDITRTNRSQWLALGDSFTMAVQVSEEDTFMGQLSDDSKYIWNGGVDGYSTWQATKRLQQILQNKLPIEQVIVTFFTGNDFQDNERFPHMQRAPLPGKEGNPIPRENIPTYKKLLLKTSVLYAHYRIAQHRQNITSATQQQSNWKDELSIFSSSGQGRLQRLTEATKKALRNLQHTAKRNNIKLLVAVAPPAFVVDTKRAIPAMSLVNLPTSKLQLNAPQKTILQLLQQQQMQACDLTQALRLGQEKEDMYFTYDGHWTKAGHKVVAKRIASCLSL